MQVETVLVSLGALETQQILATVVLGLAKDSLLVLLRWAFGRQ